MAPEEVRGRAGPGHLATAAVWWLAYLGLYLWLVSGLTWQEVVAGIPVAAVAVAATVVALRGAAVDLVGRPPALWRPLTVARIVLAEATTFARVFLRLLRGRQPQGRYVAVPVDVPVAAGSDAALTVEAGIAPNTLVVAVLEGQDVLLLHQLEASPRAKTSFPRWSG